MKYSLTIILFMLIAGSTIAQRTFDVGIFGGTSWYNGDINPNRHFPSGQMNTSAGGHFRINFDDRWSWKQAIRIGKINADDSESPDAFQKVRNLNFESPIYEFSSTVEFNFFKFDPFKENHNFSPYTFIGLGLFYMNPTTTLDGNTYTLKDVKTEENDYSNIQLAMPFGFGVKVRLSKHIILEGEWGLRRTFTDYMDDVSGNYPSDPNNLNAIQIDLSDRSLEQQGDDGTNWGTQRGDSQTNDWYSFVGVSLVVNLNGDPSKCYFNLYK